MYVWIEYALLFPFSLVSGCDHISLNPENNSYGIVEDGRPKRSSLWDWIRIELYYDKSVEMLSPEKQLILKRLISQARDYFEDTLKVERVRKLQLLPECTGGMWIGEEGSVVCELDCNPRCGTATVPQGTAIFTKCTCKDRRCPRSFEQYEGSVTHADFILFVALNRGICGDYTLAYAARCNLHPISKRPISGYVNICPNAFNAMLRNEMTRWLSTIKHELIHAFVFSTSHFANYVGAKPPTQKKPIPIVPGVLEKFTRTDWEVAGGTTGSLRPCAPSRTIGHISRYHFCNCRALTGCEEKQISETLQARLTSHDVYMIVTPKVQKEARKYFGCDTLEGAEVENQGGTGTSGSHWEKRVFENEAMSGVATQVYAVSRLTLALFEDSGWYEVNYQKAENMTWGKGLGCDFVKKSCLSWMKSPQGPYPFCTQEYDMRCNANRKSKVSCNLATNTAGVPPEYDYNIPNLYKDEKNRSIVAYGQEQTADYCPYYRVFGEISKEATDTRCTYSGNMYYNNYSLEIFSRSARCFSLDGGIKVKRKLQRTTYSMKVGCYEVEPSDDNFLPSTSCKDNRLHIKMQSSKFYPCYYTGQFIHVEKRVLGVGKVYTRIVCPSCKEICGDNCMAEEIHNEKIGDYEKISTSLAVLFSIIIVLMFFF